MDLKLFQFALRVEENSVFHFNWLVQLHRTEQTQLALLFYTIAKEDLEKMEFLKHLFRELFPNQPFTYPNLSSELFQFFPPPYCNEKACFSEINLSLQCGVNHKMHMCNFSEFAMESFSHSKSILLKPLQGFFNNLLKKNKEHQTWLLSFPALPFVQTVKPEDLNTPLNLPKQINLNPVCPWLFKSGA